MFSILALAGSAFALNNTTAFHNATTTVESTAYVTIPCSSTTLTYGNSTYTVSEKTTLTVQDCSCTDNSAVPTLPPTGKPSGSAAAANGTAAPIANNAGAATVGAAAGVVAAVAYLL